MRDATIKEVAALAGVSIATVSRFINNNGYVSKEVGDRISKAIQELDYVPNRVAISLKKTSTKTIGIVIPDLSNVSFMDTVKGISDVAIKNNYEPIILSSEEDSESEKKILDVLVSKRVDGIIIASTGGNEEKILKTNESKIPVVLVDRDVCNRDGEIRIDAVVNDNFNGSYKMVNYLISLGHERIAIITSQKSLTVANERLEGYIRALEHNNMNISSNYILYGELNFYSGYELTKEVIMQPLKPTAIYAANNLVALGVVAALNEMKISIPSHMSVCAFGDFKYYNVLNPTLTVVNQMAYKIGKESAELLMEKIKHFNKWEPRKVVIPAEIIIRNSCSKPY